jgi:hypothetical protein
VQFLSCAERLVLVEGRDAPLRIIDWYRLILNAILMLPGTMPEHQTRPWTQLLRRGLGGLSRRARELVGENFEHASQPRHSKHLFCERGEPGLLEAPEFTEWPQAACWRPFRAKYVGVIRCMVLLVLCGADIRPARRH